MRWLDFSDFKSTLQLRKKGTDDRTTESLFVAKPIGEQFVPAIKNAFVSLGFAEDSRGFLVAPTNKTMIDKLFALKKVKVIDVDQKDILDNSPYDINNSVDINDKIRAENEHSGNEDPSNRTLEGVSSGALSSDEPEGRPDDGSGSGVNTDNEGDGLTQDGGSYSVGGLARGANIVSADETERPIFRDESDDELNPATPFEIGDDIHLGEGTRSVKLSNNMAAIRLVKLLEKEGRTATEKEKLELVKFIGWGGLKSVFNPRSKSRQDQAALTELKALLTDDEMQWAFNGVLAQHFTSEEVVESMYKIIDHMGFSGGNVIEPTLGIGSFIGLMPEHMRSATHWYGAEIDPIPGKIAQHLYPEASILSGVGFQHAEFQYNKFDMVIGNPPFGDERITDTNEFRSEISHFKIHNYIIAKSAMHLKVGGILPMVVTHRFLDAKNDEARAFLAKHFDLLTAIRLPNNAFKGNAGTEVVTDLIFFKKRDPELAPGNMNWLNNNALLSVDSEGREIRVNQFFVDNPELMLGTPSMDGSLYSGYGKVRNEFTLDPFEGKTIADQINNLIDNQLAPIKDVLRGANESSTTVIRPLSLNQKSLSIGGYLLENDVIWYREDDDSAGNSVVVQLHEDTRWTEKTNLGKTRYNRIKGMLQIRNLGYELISAERENKFNIEALRLELNAHYDEFIDQFGYINDPANSSLMDGDIRIEFGMEKNYKCAISATKAKKRSIEKAGSIAEKADILLHRVFYPDREVLFASDASDAYSVSLSERGRVDFDYMSKITGQSVTEIQHELSTLDSPLIFKDPKTGEWIQEDLYLSGNVKAKLAEALTEGDEFSVNAAALTKVLPADINVNEIFVDIGQTWIPKDIYEQFLTELGYEEPSVYVSHKLGSVTMNIRSVDRHFGTELSLSLDNKYISIGEMFNAIANKKSVVVYYKDDFGNSRVDHENTQQANIITHKMGALFRDWIFADNLRAKRLEEIYNETQNTTVDRKFDGQHLKLYNNNPSIQLRDTQKKGAWRMTQSQATLLDHVVSAGKTYTITAGVMERKRLGLSKKPCIAVPNHLVRQWAVDFIGMYPGANIMAASEADFAKKNRKKLFAKIATSDFDVIIIGHSSLKHMAIDKDIEVRLINEELSALQSALDNAEGGGAGRRTVRALSNQIAKRRDKITSLNSAKKDDVATFNDMGIDYLVIDESHMFKNLEYSSGMNQVSGMGNPLGSQRAFDLYLKISSLRDSGGGVAFATGTPISNSLVEMYAIMRYLNPEGLEERNLSSFDAWAKNYALIENRIEYTATNTLKERTVMSSFNNIPEMLQLYTEFSDMVGRKDLISAYASQIKTYNEKNNTQLREEFPIPKVKGDGRQLVMAPIGPDQMEYMDYLIERTLKIDEDRQTGDFDPKVDNLLWIYSDAKKAALDIRVVDPFAPDFEHSKVNRMINEVVATYHKWHADKGTQLIFCDLSTPSKHAGKKAKELIKQACDVAKIEPTRLSELSYQDKWHVLADKIHHELNAGDVTDARREQLEAVIITVESDFGALITADTGFSIYDDVKKKLINLGIPEGEIQFIHDYDKAQDKKELFDMVNSGTVRVLIGSTAKMGMGTNVQERLVGAHHLDPSMYNRPSDIEQREGRIIRQGNQLYYRDPDNFEVEIGAYSTSNTFDAVSWQLLARKASMIEGFRTGLRSIEENHSDSATYLEFMAETTGNPIFREKIRLEKDIEILESEERRVSSRLSSARYALSQSEGTKNKYLDKIALYDETLALTGNASVIKCMDKVYKMDYQSVYEEERQAYLKEFDKHKRAVSNYEKEYAKWISRDLKDRGEKPAKPSPLDNPESINSKRMMRSEQFQFNKFVIESIPSRYSVMFSLGDLEFTLNKSGLNKQDQMTYGITSNTGYKPPTGGALFIDSITGNAGLFKALIKAADRKPIKELLDYNQGKLNDHNKEMSHAENVLKTGGFDKADELQKKRERYSEVQEFVGEIEKAEQARRLSSVNRYMERDHARFPHYGEQQGEDDGMAGSVTLN